jgi:choline dehydrogenase-like flavoprotein
VELLPVGLLAEVFATLAPMTPAEARRRAEAAAETLAATRDRAEVAQLGLVLRSLELPALNALDGGGWVSFSRASQDARERILRAWATSRLAQRRTAFQALKRIGLFLAYADPGDDPDRPFNPMWARLGYAPRRAGPDDVPVPDLRPLDASLDGAGRLALEADVVIVGSGAGGGVAAARLSAAGRSVLVVEAGGYVPAAGVPSSEAMAWRDLYLDRGTTGPDDASVTILAGATLGGGTTVNWTTSIAPPAWVLDEWERDHGLPELRGTDADADLARLTDELGLMPPTAVPPKDRLILDGARALGWEADTTRRNAGPCTECGSCGFGCHRGTKRSTARVHLLAAQAAGARILADARVSRVLLRGGRTVGVQGRLAGGRPFVVRSPQVVVAGGALRTPLILQASGTGHPEVGRNLHLHPSPVIAAQLPGRVAMWEGPTQAARSAELLGPERSILIESAPAHPGLAAAALPWLGRDAGTELLSRLDHLAPLIGIVRDRGAGTITRRRSGRASIRYRLAAVDAVAARAALVAMARIAEAGGADEMLALTTEGERWRRGDDLEPYLRRLAAVDTAPNRMALFSAHQMGSARAGADPRRSACDAWGRVRSDDRGGVTPGLYVADASLMPTALGVNPMLTIMLLAERTARAVLDDAPVAAGA